MCSLAQVNEPPLTHLPGIVQVHVALVQQQVDAAVVGQVDNPLQVLGAHHLPAGFDGEFRIIALVRGVMAFSIASAVIRKLSASLVSRKHHLAARVLNDVFEADPIGNRQNHLVAVVHQDLDGVEERQLAAGGEDGLVDV
jgi:hypothetical protein